jgi:hypothetical protein
MLERSYSSPSQTGKELHESTAFYRKSVERSLYRRMGTMESAKQFYRRVYGICRAVL